MKITPPRSPARTRSAFTDIQEMLDLSEERSKRTANISRAYDAIAAAEAQGVSHRRASLWFDILIHPAYGQWLQVKVKGRTAWREIKRELVDSLWRMLLTLATLLAYLIWVPFLIYLVILFLS